jgi:hypothetical protein
MQNHHDVEGALARIRAMWLLYAPNTRDPHVGSNSALAAEYLHRMALWADALNGSGWPFFSVAQRMAQMAQETPWAHEFSNIPDLDALDQQDVFRGDHLHVLKYYVQWCAVRDADYARRFQLPDPYEPAILNYERGGAYWVENRMIDMGGFSLSIGTRDWRRERPALRSLEPDYLDQLDAEYRARREKVDS